MAMATHRSAGGFVSSASGRFLKANSERTLFSGRRQPARPLSGTSTLGKNLNTSPGKRKGWLNIPTLMLAAASLLTGTLGGMSLNRLAPKALLQGIVQQQAVTTAQLETPPTPQPVWLPDGSNFLDQLLGTTFSSVTLADGSRQIMLGGDFRISAETLDQTLNTSVRVVIPNQSAGSGVIIRDAQNRFYILTNYHVVDDLPEGGHINVQPYGSWRRFRAERVFYTENPDLALLRVQDSGFSPSRFLDLSRFRDLASEPLIEMEPVFLVGYPRGREDEIIPGVVRLMHPYWGGIQYKMTCNPGSSGSPVFDLRGRFLGVNTMMMPDPEKNAIHCFGIAGTSTSESNVRQWLAGTGVFQTEASPVS